MNKWIAKYRNLVSALTAIMTAQVALLSRSEKNANLYNGVTGVIVGSVTVLLAIYVYYAPKISVVGRERNVFRLVDPHKDRLGTKEGGSVRITLCKSVVYGSYVYVAGRTGEFVDGRIVRTAGGWKRLPVSGKIVCIVLSEILVFVWAAGYAVYFFRSLDMPRKLEGIMAGNGWEKTAEPPCGGKENE